MDNNRVVIGLYYYRQGEMLLKAIETQLKTGKTFKGEYFLTGCNHHHAKRWRQDEDH